MLDLVMIAGWNQTADDLERLLSLEPEGCLCIRIDDRVVATTSLLCHDRSLAWLGMVLTHPDYRRRGFARRLVGAALDLASGRGIRTVKLDASDEGRPLYRDLGFVDEQPIQRWRREPGPWDPDDNYDIADRQGFEVYRAELDDGARLRFTPDAPDVLVDFAAFGADRNRFLAGLGPGLQFETGCLFHRAGRLARYLGPCVAEIVEDAEEVIRYVIASHAREPWIWDLLPSNGHAVGIALDTGFTPVRSLTRMRRGAAIAAEDNLAYAIAGFEAG